MARLPRVLAMLGAAAGSLALLFGWLTVSLVGAWDGRPGLVAQGLSRITGSEFLPLALIVEGITDGFVFAALGLLALSALLAGARRLRLRSKV